MTAAVPVAVEAGSGARLGLQLRRAGLRLVLGRGFERALDEFGASQWLPADVVRERQWTRLREVLSAAYGLSSLYRERLNEAGWPAMTPETFRRLRPLDRGDLERLSHELARRRAAGLWRTSGGTGGSAVTVSFDRRAYGWYVAGTSRGLGWWGVDLSRRGVLLLGRSARSPLTAAAAWVKDWAMNWRRIPVDVSFDAHLSAVIERIDAWQPAFLYGYPSAVFPLARLLRERRAEMKRPPLVVVLTGEPVYAFQRETIEAAFGCRVAREYGSGELGCVAFECPAGRLHVNAETVLLERNANGEGGGAGRLLATHLRNATFPLIRYDTGDLGTVETVPCACGRSLPVVDVAGRARERTARAGGETPPDGLFGALPERLRGRVQVAYEAPGVLTLRVEGGAGPELDAVADAGRQAVGPGWRVRACAVGRLGRLSSGKLPYVVDGSR